MSDISRRNFLFSTLLAATGSVVTRGGHSFYRIHNNFFSTIPSFRLAENVIPVIGAWFPQESEMQEHEGYKDFLDAAAEHSTYTLLTTTMRNRGRQMTDAYVHNWFKRAVAYAKERGIGIALELDVRHSLKAYASQYPHAMQQRLWLKEYDLKHNGATLAEMTYTHSHGDAITYGSASSIILERVYTYQQSPRGVKPETVMDITNSCKVEKIEGTALSVLIPADIGAEGYKACVIARVTFVYADVFSPELLDFEAGTIRQYADLPLAGLMKDEWGFPADHHGNPHKNCFWTSKYRETDYTARTGGWSFVRNSLLMYLGEAGRKAERQAAINHYMKQSTDRNSEIEHRLYTQTKENFGPDAFVGTHDTVFPYPDSREFERNGLNWWTATRDFGQTDEITPYCCRTSLAKKFGKPVWFNQWYSKDIGSYQKKIWSYALTGGRMNFHILYPYPGRSYKECGKDLLRTTLLRGDSRIRMLNEISDAPLDCPVAVVFGHTNVMNWAGPSFEDVGTRLTDAFWRAGLYADLIPSTEIEEKSLQVDDQGEIWFGKQRYSAVVLYNPEFESPSTGAFFRQAAKGTALLYRIGEWTKDFNAQPLDAGALLPDRMKLSFDVQSCAMEMIPKLKASGIEPQTPSRGEFPEWHGKGRTSIDMPASGRSRLTDGTVILVAGENNPTGDPIQKTIYVNGHDVIFDAIGVAAVKLAEGGTLEAMAAGGLKTFAVGETRIELPKRADIALWKDEKGVWQGVLQDYRGEVPAKITTFCKNWVHLRVPSPITGNPSKPVIMHKKETQ